MPLSTSELVKALLNNIKVYSVEDQHMIRRAFEFGSVAHSAQRRNTGEPYINHPLQVAVFLSQRDYDQTTITSALLHDILEDTSIDFSTLKDEFGFEIAQIVEGVTKISKVPIKDKSLFFSPENYFAERVDNYRKLLLSTAKDIRVVVIKLFDRLHNIQTLDGLAPEKRRFYAIETIEIYAQIADRLGLGEIKRLLENTALPFAYPEEYKRFIASLDHIPHIEFDLIDIVIEEIRTELARNGLDEVTFQGRVKNSYSIFKKFRAVDFNYDNFHDLYAFRVIVKNISDCYKALGIIHSLYTPVKGRIFDMIAEPKANGYQSLHTTVRNSQGKVFEIQIRTEEMHKTAEFGQASHWRYKEQEYGNSADSKSDREWLEELSKLRSIEDKKEFLNHLKNDLFAKKIFVFTPNGDIFNLPQGASVIDFAFRIHSSLGEKCSGAKVNGCIAELSTKLRNSDVVEILTANRAKPSIDWLTFAATPYAKQKIRRCLKKFNLGDLQNKGRSIFNDFRVRNALPPIDDKAADHLFGDSRLPYNTFADVLVALAENVITPHSISKVLYPGLLKPEKRRQTQLINDSEVKVLSGIRYQMAKCCKPNTSQKIVGYIGRDHIIKIHRANCKFIKNADPKRFIHVDLFDSLE